MDIAIIAALLAAAIILFLVEVFFIPGFSIAGMAALGCALYANYYAFTRLGNPEGFITLAITAVAGFGSLVWFMRSKTLEKMALKETNTATVDIPAEEKVRIGDTGTCLTRLALMGQAEFDGKTMEVKSADGFLDEKTSIVVSRIVEGIIWVKKQ